MFVQMGSDIALTLLECCSCGISGPVAFVDWLLSLSDMY